MKRRTFLQLVVMLSSKAIFLHRALHMRIIQKRMVTYISLLILQLISPRDLRKKLMMMILVQPQTLFWPTAKLAIQ